MREKLTGEDEGGEWRERLLGGSTPTESRPVAASVMLRLSRWMEVELAADDMTLLIAWGRRCKDRYKERKELH